MTAIATMKNNGELCSIINRASIDAMIGESVLAAYCASKGSVRSITKAAAVGCAEAGYTIRVNSVHPGLIHTVMAEREAKELGITFQQYEKKFRVPVGHAGEPIDIAYMDLYLASDESRFVTGSEFVADGGLLASCGLRGLPSAED